MPKKLIVANWKMHLGGEEGISYAHNLSKKITALPEGRLPYLVICPPFTVLRDVRKILPEAVKVGGQNCAPVDDGPYTGEVSAKMLKEAGASYVILGHSERREYSHERNAQINLKGKKALAAGLTPIICVGETHLQRDEGSAQEIVEQQVIECCKGLDRYIIAYEPVWAIGSGRVPTAKEIGDIHEAIAATISGDVKIIYGGSVSAETVSAVLAVPRVDGVLVGGASLTLERFWPLVVG